MANPYACDAGDNLCELFTDLGNGAANLIDAINLPVVTIVAAMGIVTGTVGMFVAIANRIASKV